MQTAESLHQVIPEPDCDTMCHMKSVNVRELHHHTGATVDHVAAGNVVIIEKRGVPVAEIRPIARRARRIPASHWTFLEAFPNMPDDSGRAISPEIASCALLRQ